MGLRISSLHYEIRHKKHWISRQMRLLEVLATSLLALLPLSAVSQELRRRKRSRSSEHKLAADGFRLGFDGRKTLSDKQALHVPPCPAGSIPSTYLNVSICAYDAEVPSSEPVGSSDESSKPESMLSLNLGTLSICNTAKGGIKVI